MCVKDLQNSGLLLCTQQKFSLKETIWHTSTKAVGSPQAETNLHHFTAMTERNRKHQWQANHVHKHWQPYSR